MQANMNSRYRISSLDKGLKVLSCFTPQRRQIGASEVARLSGIPVSTVYRILRTLVDSGFVEQLEDGNFTPGVGVLKLGFAALQGNEVVEAASGPLKELRRSTGETCNLGVLSGGDLVYLLRYKTAHYVIGNVSVGSSLAATCTAMGKTLLAMLEPEELSSVLAGMDLTRAGVGPHAHRTTETLMPDLAKIRQRGWAMQDEEVAHGLRAIALPVRNLDGVVAAVGISVEGARWPRDRMTAELLDALRETAQKVSLRLGYLEGVAPSRRPGLDSSA
ncbi:IclR family transcriptional regulator [Streptomyces sp. NPDC020951]|uniref:IclR family transcriptional regulator n=1 Tax=Streptomyces sp. NPDC020951 TaxID=3365104 RepID=UPI003794A0A6